MPQLVAIALVLLAGAIVLAFSICVQMIPGSYQVVPAKVVIPAALMSFAAAVSLVLPWRADGTFSLGGLRCLAWGLGVAAVCAALVTPLARRWATWHSGWLGASIGLFAGIAGASFVHVNCHTPEAPHQLVWHTATLVTGAIVGFASARISGSARTK